VNDYGVLEHAFARSLDLDPREVMLTARTTIDALVDSPPSDVGDPRHAPNDVLDARQQVVDNICDELNGQLVTVWTRASQHKAQHAFEQFEAWLWSWVCRWRLEHAIRHGRHSEITVQLNGVRHSIGGLVGGLACAGSADRYQTNTAILLQLFWGLYLDKIEQDLIADPSARVARRAVRIEEAKQLFETAGKLWLE
jgi:hypothetical protein